MYQKLEECPACGHYQFNNFLICKDQLLTQESFALVKCSKCQLVFTNPRPTPDRIEKYFQIDDTEIQQTTSVNSVNTIVQRITGSFKKDLISEHIQTGSLLDYGRYDSRFLQLMANSNWKVESITTHPTTQNIDENTIYNTIAAIPSNTKYDVITCWHTLDQTHDLKTTFKELKKCLKQEGLMFIALSNHNSLDARKYRENWAAYDQPRALYHFTIDSFTRFVKQNRMNVLDVVPMKFHSHYVAVQSDNNIYLKKTYLSEAEEKSIANSTMMNTNDQYSSLIYILSK
jgi:hypothetical protein